MSGKPPRIIITGPTGCGKSTQAKFIRDEMNLVLITVPNLLHHAREEGPRSLIVGSYLDNGQLPPETLIVQLISERIRLHDCVQNGWILDGFPITKVQAELLRDIGFECDILITLEPPETIGIERTPSRLLGHNMIRDRLKIRSESEDEGDILQDFKANLPTILSCFPNHLTIQVNGDSKYVWNELYPKLKKKLLKSVIFVLGGPCSGKHTHSMHIQRDFHILHISLDDLIENEKRNRTELYKNMKYITDRGSILPSDIVCNLILNVIITNKEYTRFIIDSFPRNINDLNTWLSLTERICTIDLVLYLKCSEDNIQLRINEIDNNNNNQNDNNSNNNNNNTNNNNNENNYMYGINDSALNSSRMDDNVSSIAKRFKLFREFTIPVISFFQRCGKLCEINATVPMNTVFHQISGILNVLPKLPPYERTVLIIKPDIVREGKISIILEEINTLYITSILTKFVIMNEKTVELIAKEYLLDSSYSEVQSYLMSGPSLIVVIEGTDAIRRVKELVGNDDPKVAKLKNPNSLRGKYGINKICNSFHCSSNEITALLDIDLWYNPIKSGYQSAVEGPIIDINQLNENKIENSSISTTLIINEEYLIPTEDTLALIKPYSSEIHSETLKSIIMLHGYEILSEVKLRLNEKLIDEVYSWKIGAIPYVSFKELLLSGSVIALHLRRVSAIKGMRYLIGSDDPYEWKVLRKDCLRGIYGLNKVHNCIESSESVQIAMKELNFYFPQTCKLIQQQLVTSTDKKTEISTKDMPKYVEKIRLTAKRRKKNQGPTPISILKHTDMLKYLTDEVNPVMKDLLQRMLINRPKDVLGYAIKDLIEQQRLSMESTSRMKINPPLKPLPQLGNLTIQPLVPSIIQPVLPSIQDNNNNSNNSNNNNNSNNSIEKPENELNNQDNNNNQNNESEENDVDDFDENTTNNNKDQEISLLMDMLGLGLDLVPGANKDDTPSYNGKPLTVDIAKAEIIRLRHTIQLISQNIIADSTSIQNDKLLNQPSNQTLTTNTDVQNTIKTIEFIHFSDLVGMGKEYDDILSGDSIAKFVTTIKQQSQNKPMILFSGNFLGCTKSFTSSHFSSMFEILNTAGVNYGILGNRDFEFGVKALENHIQNSSTTWILSNVVDTKTQNQLLNCERDLLVQWNGVMVGILGFVDNWITESLRDDDIEFLDIFSTAKSLSADLKARGAQIVIAITHCGRQRVDEKLSSIESIDLVFGGHSRGQMETWKLSDTNLGFRSTPWCTHLTKINVTIQPDTLPKISWPPGIISVHNDAIPDQNIGKILQTQREIRAKGLFTKIGAITKPLIAWRDEIRTQECNVGNMIADIIRQYTNSTFAFIHSGSIRLDGEIPAGIITVGDILKILPFYDYVTIVRMTGKKIMQMLKNSVSRCPSPDGRFLQVSGMAFEYSLEATALGDQEPTRIRLAKVGKKVIDPSITYSCAITGHLLSGKDGYKCLQDSKIQPTTDTEFCMSLHQMIFDFFRKRSLLNNLDERQTLDLTVTDFQSIEPQLTQRISLISTKHQHSYYSRSALIIDSDDESNEEEEEDEVSEIDTTAATGEGESVAGNSVVDVSNIMSGASDYIAEDVGRTYFRKKSMD